MGSVKTISIIVAANIKGLEAGLGKANKSLASFASNAARMGSIMSFGVTAPLTALGKSAFDTFSKFENGMTKVQAVTNASVKDFKMLTDEAKRLGRTTQFTAQQVADLQLVLGRKGFDPKAIKNMEGSILDLALATGEDLTLAADVVSSSLNAFKLGARDASRVTNVLASAAANSSIQLSTFSTAFGHAGTAAKSVGVDFEQLAAMMGILMDNGIKASKAGTGLRKIFIELAEKGVSFNESLDKITKGQLDIIDTSDKVGKTAAAQLKILADNKDEVKELTKEYKSNTNSLKAMVDLMGGTTEAKVEVMNSAVEGLKLEFGALMSDALIPLIDEITKFSSWLSSLDEKTKSNILKFGALAAAIGPVLMLLAGLTSMLSPVLTAFKLLNRLIPFSIKGTSAFGIALGRLTVAGWGANGAIGALTGVFRAFKLVIISNPLGALLIALSAAIGLWYRFRDSNKEANAELNNTSTAATSAAERIKEINKHLDDRDKSGDDLLREEIEGFKALTEETLKLKRAALNLGQDEFGVDFDLVKIGDLKLEIGELEDQLISYQNTLDRINKTVEETTLTPKVATVNLPKKTTDSVGQSEFEKPQDLIGGKLEFVEPTFFENLDSQLQTSSSKISEFFMNWGDHISMIGDIFGQMLENQMIKIDNHHARQLELIENSTMTEEQKAEAIEALEEKTAEKKAKIQRKQAIAQKAAAIISATINGAEAITKVAGQTGIGAIAAAPLMAALVGAQIAMIAASPIPAFADGGRPPLGQVSLVGERGPELFVPDKAGTVIPNHLMGAFAANAGSGNTMTVIPDVRISGDDLLIVFDRANRRKNRR